MAVNMNNYGFFDYRSGDDDKYKYTAEEFTHILSYIVGNGVPVGTGKQLDFDVNASTSARFIMKPGAVWINGHCGWNVNSVEILLTQGAAGTTDLIVARLDNDNRKIVLEQKIGTTETTADEVALYTITWSANTYTAESVRPLLWLSGGLAAQQVVFSANVPTNPSEGMIWLRPV